MVGLGPSALRRRVWGKRDKRRFSTEKRAPVVSKRQAARNWRIRRKKGMAKDKVRAKIEELEAELKNLAESRRLPAEQMTALGTQQRREMVDARVRKIEAAQANVDRLSGEIAKLRTEDAWDCAAIEELSTNLAEEKVRLCREQWRTRCATVNRLLKPRAKGVLEQRLLDLVLQLRQTAAEIAE